jgi:hypothetical protein
VAIDEGNKTLVEGRVPYVFSFSECQVRREHTVHMMICDEDETEMRDERAEARERLLGEWSSIQKLPFKELGRLCGLVGVTRSKSRIDQLVHLKVWCEAQGVSSCASGRRASPTGGKRGWPAVDDKEEEAEDGDDGDGEDEDDGGGSGDKVSKDVAGQGLSPGQTGVAAAMLAAVHKVHSFQRLAKAAVWFPDQSLATAHGQHEYNFLKKIRRKVMAVNHDMPGEVLKLVVELQEDIKRHAHIVVVGEEEGWETAGCLKEDEGSFIAGWQDKLTEAWKKAVSHKKVHKVALANLLFQLGWAGRRRGGTRYPGPARDDHGVPVTGDPPASTAEPQSQQPAGQSITCYMCGGSHYAKECPKKWDWLAV